VATHDNPAMPMANLLDHALRRLNSLPDQEARMELLTCCGSRRWAARVSAGRPYADNEALLAAADMAWDVMTPADVREAFAAHPRIGEPSRGGAQERGEQSASADADEATRDALAEGNLAYEERFGHIYLVCASGRSAGELLEDLRSRLGNDPATEFRIAAEEQRAITRLRLRKLLAP
jgi:2-oxo-4-hydroxy-4-carboxy-5-ureidoimidazoline decarboxylase